MKIKLATLLILIGIFFVSSIFASNEIQWLDSFPQAIKQAKSEDKIIMIDFSSDWCGWCKKLRQTTFQNSNVMELLKDNFVTAELNVGQEENKNLSNYYNVTGFPTILFVNPDSSEVDRIVGYVLADEFIKKATFILNNRNYFQKLFENAKMYPDSIEIQMKLAEIYEKRGRYSEVEKIYSSILMKAKKSQVPEIQTKIALLDFHRRQFDKALEKFQTIENEFPDYPKMDEILFNQAVCLYQLKLFDEAKNILERIKQDFPQGLLIENVEKFLQYLSSQN